jgi:inner membrane protein
MNDILNNPAVLWFLTGLVLLLAELALPGLIIFFFGVGAWVTAAFVLMLDISFPGQLGVFIASSVLSLGVMRRFLLKKFGIKRNISSELSEEFLGHTCTVIKTIVPGPAGGKVNFRGTTWNARSGHLIEEGSAARIIAKESIVLIVEPIS